MGNRANALTIRLQQGEISLLRAKSQSLSDRNTCFAQYKSTMKARRVAEYNLAVQHALHEQLQHVLPRELRQLLCEFSRQMMRDCVRMRYQHRQRRMLKSAYKMDAEWVWNRFLFCDARRAVSSVEYVCWMALFYWLRIAAVLTVQRQRLSSRVCAVCHTNAHTLKVALL